MIFIETDRIYAIYIRTNRRTNWIYALYGGRYKTIEEAIKKAKKEMKEKPFEYRIEEIGGKIVEEGIVNPIAENIENDYITAFIREEMKDEIYSKIEEE